MPPFEHSLSLQTEQGDLRSHITRVPLPKLPWHLKLIRRLSTSENFQDHT
jgi:hypothetical protein